MNVSVLLLSLASPDESSLVSTHLIVHASELQCVRVYSVRSEVEIEGDIRRMHLNPIYFHSTYVTRSNL